MFRAIAILIIGTLFLACIFTPPLYSAIAKFYGDFPWPYSRVFDRVAMLFAAILIYVYRKEFSLRALKEYFKGWRSRGKLGSLGLALLLSFITSMLVLPLVVGKGELVWKEISYATFSLKLLKALGAGLAVSLIEESFFRVLLFSKLKERFALLPAMITCSLIYAIVHFIAPVKTWEYPGFSLTIGFEYMLLVFERMANPALLPALFGLFLVGMVLCYVIERSRSIFLCIGLHMGWVAAVKMSRYISTTAEGFEFPSAVGARYFLVAEPYAWASILIVGLIMYFVIKRRFKDIKNA